MSIHRLAWCYHTKSQVYYRTKVQYVKRVRLEFSVMHL